MRSQIRCPNPDHHDEKPSCAIYTDHLFCFSQCGYIYPQQYEEWTGASFGDLLQSTLPNESDKHRASGRSNVAGRVSYWHETLMRGPRSSRKEWYYSRGFTERALLRWKFGHTGTHFSIPLWDADRLLGYKLRRDDCFSDPGDVKYKNQYGLGRVVVRPNPTGTPTVVVEGELDAYLLALWGVDAITISTGSRTLASLSVLTSKSVQPIYVIPDNDQAGTEGAKHLVETTPDRFRLLRLPDGTNDVTDYLCSFQPEERAQALRSLFNARPNTVEASG